MSVVLQLLLDMRRIDNFTTRLNIIQANKLIAFVEAHTVLVPNFNDIKTLIFLNDAFRANTKTLDYICAIIDNLAEHRCDRVHHKIVGRASAADTKTITTTLDVCVVFIERGDTFAHPEKHALLNTDVLEVSHNSEKIRPCSDSNYILIRLRCPSCICRIVVVQAPRPCRNCVP